MGAAVLCACSLTTAHATTNATTYATAHQPADRQAPPTTHGTPQPLTNLPQLPWGSGYERRQAATGPTPSVPAVQATPSNQPVPAASPTGSNGPGGSGSGRGQGQGRGR